MSTYFPSFRRRERVTESHEHEQATSSELGATQSSNTASLRQNNTASLGEYAPSTSMLIFPFPSSIPPTPDSQSAPIPGSPSSGSTSNFSLPTSISVGSSIFSENGVSTPSFVRRLRLREAPRQQAEANHQSSIPLGSRLNNGTPGAYPNGLLDVELESASEGVDDGSSLEVEVWGWSSLENSNQGSRSQSQAVSPSMQHASMQASDFELLWQTNQRLRTISQFTNFTTASNESGLSHFSHSTAPSSKEPLAPTPIHFPLLSWITRFFKIDPETILLLGASGRSSGEESHLFVSTPFDLQSTELRSDETEGLDQQLEHPSMLTLLVKFHSPTSRTESIRSGLQAASECESTMSESSYLQRMISVPLFLASGAMGLTGEAVRVSTSVIGQALRATSISLPTTRSNQSPLIA
ncbi:hypothetical protein FRC14_003362 [Serendipita sp. 396]|nr:hypothetical protein FRC14_003362 [Serendipita sp. 396]KAG8788292.1 hypothetical protein FRC15_005172 [Serendipita sp. 397]KAG8803527.1 hypothetical protein FRC16_004935 [Serendipita sp. 398]KAG8825832.1 hypothetical protein FRC19_010385 [Serendipita sp. 401]KAG8847910.1 hypothetical protein FRB91_011331 [Serendipita sp. 411]KAG8874579.1 hypothetical protein FRC20_005702 [Serendipita sp. 405]KAG9056607.1 hypothetical protein FS842_010210 [Serendipita sp. 407]